MNAFGAYNRKIDDVSEISCSDIENLYNLFSVLNLDDSILLLWLQKENLLRRHFFCDKCNEECYLGIKKSKTLGHLFKCSANKNHGVSVLKDSFFERTHVNIRDLLLFTHCYLDGQPLYKCGSKSGIESSTTRVNWASYIRDIFLEEVSQILNSGFKFSGIVEIDESLFGYKCKYNRGVRKAVQNWIFGLTDRASNRILLFPVEDRTAGTLLPIIEKFVEKGSKIFSDGWSSYLQLNECGFEHFVVNHSTSYTQEYVNVDTNEIITCHTNKIEGAWNIAKKHFKSKNGCSQSTFESHLAEVIWRQWDKDSVINRFFTALTSIFNFEGPPNYTAQRPLFTNFGTEVGETSFINYIDNTLEHPDFVPSDTQEPTTTVNNSTVQPTTTENVTVRKRRISARPALEDTTSVYSNTLKCPSNFVPVQKKTILETINLANSDEEFQPEKKAGKDIHICRAANPQ